jgi:hypothetical protein
MRTTTTNNANNVSETFYSNANAETATSSRKRDVKVETKNNKASSSLNNLIRGIDSTTTSDAKS